MSDDDDQKHLREDVCVEVKAVLERHGVAGVVLVSSRESQAWAVYMPEWSALQLDPVYGLALRARKGTPGNMERVVQTVGMVAAMRDCCSEFANVFGWVFREAKRQIEAQGGKVEHTPFNGGRGIFPGGRRGG